MLSPVKQVEVSFTSVISAVDPLLAPSLPAADEFISPGWIDLQVNGFAGVDYNSPSASGEEIERSVQEMFRTGVTRFFPTVITGSPERMHRRVSQSRGRQGNDSGRRRHGSLPFGGPLHLA